VGTAARHEHEGGVEDAIALHRHGPADPIKRLFGTRRADRRAEVAPYAQHE
jgi:hypothetical protein